MDARTRGIDSDKVQNISLIFSYPSNHFLNAKGKIVNYSVEK